jgi:hypothetical protein
MIERIRLQDREISCGLPLGNVRLHGPHRRGTDSALDLGLLVYREHYRVLRRIYIYSQTTFWIFASNSGSVEDLTVSHRQAEIPSWRHNRLTESCDTRVPGQRNQVPAAGSEVKDEQ